jgi:hypothetical protein
MKSVRTPDERFANIANWPYEPVYTTVAAGDGTADTLRVAHYETGPKDAANTILVMHGEPSWSFLYRKMMSAFVAAGHRVIAPDLVGFGRSDKPTNTSDYTYERHVAWMNEWLRTNNFTNLTLVGGPALQFHNYSLVNEKNNYKSASLAFQSDIRFSIGVNFEKLYIVSTSLVSLRSYKTSDIIIESGHLMNQFTLGLRLKRKGRIF